MDLLNSALGIHDKALRVRNQRMELLARNIANEDTPHFKARELDFNYLTGYMLFGDMALSDAMRSLQLFSREVMPKIETI